MEITPEKCNGQYVQTECIEYRHCEVNANAKRKINRALRGLRQWRHMERKAGVCVSMFRQLVVDRCTRRQQGRRRKFDVLASGLERSLARKTIHGDRTAVCDIHLHLQGKQMAVSRNDQRKARRHRRGMQCPRKGASGACPDRCMGHKWIHHAV
jgi:hypothetical protein